MTEGATLALHKSNAPAGTEASQQSELPGTCRPGFQVPNLDGFHARMIEHDVPCIQEPTETFGTRIAQYVDPDGLVWALSHAWDEA